MTAQRRKFGWHSGVLYCRDIKCEGDLYIQDDIVFSDVTAGKIGITGGIDMTATTSAVGIDMSGGSFSTAEIRLQNAATIDNSTNGLVLCTEPTFNFRCTTSFIVSYDASNYLTTTVSSAGVTKLAPTGSADSFEIETGDGSIILDAKTDIDLDPEGNDINLLGSAAGKITLAATSISIYGGDTSGDDLILYANSDDTTALQINGGAGLVIAGTTTADITLPNGATIHNTNATTLTITESQITLVGSTGIKLDGTVTLDDDGTIADASNIMTITQDTITLAGATKINLDGPVDVSGALVLDTAVTTGITLNAVAMTTGISIAATGLTDGIVISGNCANAINITGTANLIGIQYNVDQAAQIGATVEGIKIILERTADVLIGTSNLIGQEIIIKQGGTGYATAYAPTIKGFRVAIDGDNAIATNVWGIIAETQSNGVTDALVRVALNTGGTCKVGMVDVSAFANTGYMHMLTASATITSATLIRDNNAVGTITNVFETDCANSTNFLKCASDEGYLSGVTTHNTQSDEIVIDVGGTPKYIKLYT